MSQLSELPSLPAVYSYAQRWCPIATREAGQEPVRGRIAILMDETANQCVAMELLPAPMDELQTRDWIVRQLANPGAASSRPGRPRELLLEDQHLLQALRFTFQPAGVKLRVDTRTGALDHFLFRMNEELGREEDFSLVEAWGRERALEVYCAAERFFLAKPWEKFPNSLVLSYATPEGEVLGVVVMGSGREEYGLSLYPSPNEAHAMLEGAPAFPAMGFGLHTPAFIPWLDLDLMDRHGLRFPDGQYPWFLAPHGALSTGELENLHWLLQIFPELSDPHQLVRDGQRTLARSDVPITRQALIEQHLLRTWGKKSQRAQDLALFLSTQFCLIDPAPRSFDSVLAAVGWIGEDYLQTVRSRQLDLKFFQGPPPFPAGRPASYGRTWKRIVKSLAQQMRQVEQFHKTLGPLLPLLLALLEARREYGADASSSPDVQAALPLIARMGSRQFRRALAILDEMNVPEGYTAREFDDALQQIELLCNQVRP